MTKEELKGITNITPTDNNDSPAFPARHYQILKDRMLKIETGEAKFIPLKEFKKINFKQRHAIVRPGKICTNSIYHC